MSPVKEFLWLCSLSADINHLTGAAMPATTTKKPSTKSIKTTTPDTDAPPAIQFHPVKFEQVKVGDCMAVLHFVKVKSTCLASSEGVPLLVVEDLSRYNSAGTFRIEGRSLIEKCLTADRYTEEVFVSQTDVIKRLLASPNRPLTVKFTKKNGEDRILRGRFIGQEDYRGYSWCLDFDVDDDNQMRQVDHRTLSWLIVDGIKFTAK